MSTNKILAAVYCKTRSLEIHTTKSDRRVIGVDRRDGTLPYNYRNYKTTDQFEMAASPMTDDDDKSKCRKMKQFFFLF